MGESCFCEIDKEFKEKGITFPKFSNGDIPSNWIGQIYRYIFFFCHKSSKELSEIIPFEKLLSYYEELQEQEIQDAALIILSRNQIH